MFGLSRFTAVAWLLAGAHGCKAAPEPERRTAQDGTLQVLGDVEPVLLGPLSEERLVAATLTVAGAVGATAEVGSLLTAPPRTSKRGRHRERAARAAVWVEEELTGFGIDPLLMGDPSAADLALALDCGCPGVLLVSHRGRLTPLTLLHHRADDDEAWGGSDHRRNGARVWHGSPPGARLSGSKSTAFVGGCASVLSNTCREGLCSGAGRGGVCDTQD